MDDKEILENAIEKAKNNGLKGYEGDIKIGYCVDSFIYGIIFSHSFAKAFWGEEKVDVSHIENIWEHNYQDEFRIYELAWKYHLQKMVIEEKPLKYIKKFL